MTEVAQFSSLAGTKTFDGRAWEPVRGSGGMKVGTKIFTAIAEENLLGGAATAKYKGEVDCKSIYKRIFNHFS